MADSKNVNLGRNQIPAEGFSVAVPAGKVLTRVHLDITSEGISLATVGAASAVLKQGNRHQVILKPAKDGISLAMVGAAQSIK